MLKNNAERLSMMEKSTLPLKDPLVTMTNETTTGTVSEHADAELK
jgi:hypothetical protein